MKKNTKKMRALLPSSRRRFRVLPGERAAIHSKVDEVLHGGEQREISRVVHLLLELRPLSQQKVRRSQVCSSR